MTTTGMSDLRQAAQRALKAMEDGEYRADMIEFSDAITALRQALAEPDLDHCPKCGGPADNGHDRCVPPNPYFCSKCMGEPEQPVGINGLTEAETDASASVAGLVGKPEQPVAQDTRAEFEAWAASYSTFSLKRYDDETRGITGYISVEQTMLWHAWQAAKTNAPTPRRPLTDEEIADLWDGHTVPVFGKTGINPIVFARAIERAHGITGETK